VALVLSRVLALQFGAALAASLFPALGPLGVLSLRLVAGAVALCVVVRPRLRGRSRAQWRVPIAFGLLTAVMNGCLYLSFVRLPLGAAITFEFLGPLGLALALSRRWRDVLWAGCAGLGVILLGDGLEHLDVLGVALALGAAVAWAGYILLSRQMGGEDSGGLTDLALACAVAALLVAPIGIAVSDPARWQPGPLALAALVGVLCSALPYSLDLLALRRLPARVFSVLMSIDPAAAAVAGLLVLDQRLSLQQTVAVGLVVAAGVGVTTTRRGQPTS
jgi:inner membrane transporter RhtA